jgi:hypothetical protein
VFVTPIPLRGEKGENKMKTYDFFFGVFSKGRLLFSLGRTTCTHTHAAIIVGILDLAKDALLPDTYFACDYAQNILG